MKNNKIVMVGLLAFSFSSFSRADDTLPRFEITPFGGYRLNGSLALNDASYNRLDFEDGGVFGLSAGIRVNSPEDLGEGILEFMWAHQGTTLNAIPNPGVTAQSLTMNIDQFFFNGLYFPHEFESVLPYAIAGLGATHFAPTGDYNSTTRFSWLLGGGVKIPLKRRLALRLEAKWDPAVAQSSGGVFCNSATGTCYAASSGDLLNQFDFTAGLSVGF